MQKHSGKESEASSEDLVSAIARQDRHAEHQLVYQFRPQIFALLTKLTRDRTLAEDLTHETFIIVLKSLRQEKLRQPDKLVSYLFQTARFTFYGWLRRGDNKLELRDCFDNVASPDSSVERAMTNQQNRTFLKRTISELPVNRDRDLLYRRYIRDENVTEICDALNLSSEHFHRVISRARNRLKKNVTALQSA